MFEVESHGTCMLITESAIFELVLLQRVLACCPYWYVDGDHIALAFG